MNAIKEIPARASKGLSSVSLYLYVAVAVAVVSLMMAAPAFAQETNPFAAANADLLQYGKFGLIAGGIILGIVVGVRAGKVLYKSLSS